MKTITNKLFTATMIIGSLFSCDDAVEVGFADQGVLEQIKVATVSLRNSDDNRQFRVVNVCADKNGHAAVNIQLNKPLTTILNVQLKADPKAVERYNEENGTNFEMYPADQVVIENEGRITVIPGEMESLPLSLDFKTAGIKGKSYMFPITIEQMSENIKLQQETYFFMVKNMGDIPDITKPNGLITSFYIEVRSENPLNAGEWILEESKKPLADIVCLFFANINYNETAGRVEVRMNEHITSLLKQRDKYIKPLQDKGIKVTLSILGNWDAAGVSNLAPETARYFARELKAIVDTYGLDGVEFDDEYSSYNLAAGLPGFTLDRSAYARLCYEVKKIMPDKLCCVYHIGAAKTDMNVQIEGINCGDFVDYVYEAYYNYPDFYIQDNYLGMSKRQVSPYSRNITNKLTFDENNMRKVRDEYGVQMLYNLSYDRISSYKNPMNRMGEILYGEGVIHTGKKYKKDF